MCVHYYALLKILILAVAKCVQLSRPAWEFGQMSRCYLMNAFVWILVEARTKESPIVLIGNPSRITSRLALVKVLDSTSKELRHSRREQRRPFCACLPRPTFHFTSLVMLYAWSTRVNWTLRFRELAYTTNSEQIIRPANAPTGQDTLHYEFISIHVA